MAEASESGDEKLKVFVSYARDDLELADQLVAALRACGFEPLIDRQGISAGEDWQKRLGALIAEADTVAFLLSPSALRSDMCAWEVAETDRRSKRLLPVAIKPLGAAPVPERLQQLNYIFLYPEPKAPGSGFGQGLANLVQALDTDLEWVREHTRLGQRAAEWQTGGQLENRLLSGDDIAAAKEWLARRPPNAPPPTELHLDFIRASEGAQTARESAESQRLDEIAAAQAAREKALADTEVAQNEREAALRRVRRNTLLGGGFALLFALAAGTLGWQAQLQRRAAETQRAIAIAQQLAAQGELALQTGDRHAAERGALLVVESLRRSPGTLLGRKGLASVLAYFPPLAGELVHHGVDQGAAFAFSADGRYFAASGADRMTRVWAIETGELKAEITFEHAPKTLALSAAGELLAAAGQDPVVALWRWSDESRVGEFEADGALQALAFGREDRLLGAARTQGSDEVYIWDLAQQDLFTKLRHATGDVVALQFSPDGRYLATAGWHRQIEENVTTIWDLQNRRAAARDNYLDSTALAYGRDGRLFAAGGLDRRVEVWRITEPASDEPEGRSLAVAVLAETRVDGLRSLAFSPDDRLLAIGGAGLRLWDFRADRDVAAFDHDEVFAVAFVADGRYLASASLETVRLWDLRRGPELAAEIAVPGQPVTEAPLLEQLPEICRRIGRELSPEEADEFLPPGAALVGCAGQ